MLLAAMAVFSLSPSLFSQYGTARIDLLGLAIRDVRVTRTSLEFAFHKHFSAGVSYETGKFASSTLQINSQPPVEIYKVTG